MNTELVTKETFKLKSEITTDWGNSHKLVINLEALATVEDWKLGIKLPENYKIRNIHSAEVITEEGQTYISGKNWTQSFKKGDRKKIVLIMDEGESANKSPLKPEFFYVDSLMNSEQMNQQQSSSIIDTNSEITEDWNGGYKLELNLKAKDNANNWKVDFKLPYKIREAYGVDLVDNGNGNYTISGQNDQVSLQKGQSIKPIFIIDDRGEAAQEFEIINSVADTTQPDSMIVEESLASKPVIVAEAPKSESNNSNKIAVSPSITEDWNGGYKLELDLKAKDNANNWKVDFKLPYKIREAYGIDLVDNGNGNYTISGQNDQVSLQKGQSIKPIFIIDDNGRSALEPQFDGSVDLLEPKPAGKISTLENAPVNIPVAAAEKVGQKGQFAYGEALQKNFLFFEANRSGDLGADNRIEWRQDSTLNDGSDVGRDLEGGYFDAGDHIKFIQPMTWSNTMLAWGGIDYQQAYQRSGQFDELLDAVKWGTDWFLKAHETNSAGQTERLWVQVGDKSDHYHWVSPEKIDQVSERKSYYIDAARPGSDAAAGTASALASASMLFRGVDNAYADKLLKNAVALYDFAETYKGKYSDSVPQASPMYTSWSGYWDELAAGGAWLYQATGDNKYLDKAESYFKNNIGGLGDWTYAADDHSYGAAMILATESDDPFFKGQVKNWLDTWVEGRGNVNYTPGGFAHRSPWASVPLNMSTAFAAQWYDDFVEPNQKFSDFATDQVDYVLGDNPADFSYVIGFGDKYALRPHHRGSSGTAQGDAPNDHILYGAVVGGPGAVDDFSHEDRRDDWVTNEVGTGYNAPFASAAIAQYNELGGDPLSDAQLDQLIGIDANGVGF